MKHRYLALTIGPIFATLQSARSTKALWTASYLFSWLMREILRNLRQKNGITLLNLPNSDEFFEDKKRVGLFSDRLTAKLDVGANIELQKIVSGVADKLAQKITADLNAKDYQRADEDGKKHLPEPLYVESDVRQFLKQYLRLLAVEFELPDDDRNPVKTADAFLNSLELQATFTPQQERDVLEPFFEDLFFNFFIRQEFGNDAGFRSTLEIATASFAAHDGKKYKEAVDELRKFERGTKALDAQRKQEDFIRTVRAIKPDRFKLCHKYITIVRADGDHIGHLFKTLLEQNAEKGRQLADALAQFSLAASKAIEGFGGVPVFAGGDDLLFFAPVSVEIEKQEFINNSKWERQNIFDLLDTLDELFKKKITDSDIVQAIAEKLEGKQPTMSYGLSISHHKYPLAESLDLAQRRLLFSEIKGGNHRNSIAWRVTKHSGAGFGMVSIKSKHSHQIFKALLGVKLSPEEQSNAFLASVMYKLESLEGLFTATAHKPDEHFENIIFNNFNENVHRVEVERNGKKEKELSPFLKQVVALLKACFAENPCPEGAANRDKIVRENLDRAYAALRFIHFLETEDKD
ncbi:MAG: type III-B CRISPR-associated protein Cas10/Cmr2 [Saprospiraceae bacterium]